jgi:hypothetical protein
MRSYKYFLFPNIFNVPKLTTMRWAEVSQAWDVLKNTYSSILKISRKYNTQNAKALVGE